MATRMAEGWSKALACDIRVAAEHAEFGLGEVRLGWMPGGGGKQRLPRLIPLARALRMLSCSNRITAQEALRLGLVDYVVPMDRLMLHATEDAREGALAFAQKRLAKWKGR